MTKQTNNLFLTARDARAEWFQASGVLPRLAQGRTPNYPAPPIASSLCPACRCPRHH